MDIGNRFWSALVNKHVRDHVIIFPQLLYTTFAYLQIPHLSQWNGFLSSEVKCLQIAQK